MKKALTLFAAMLLGGILFAQDSTSNLPVPAPAGNLPVPIPAAVAPPAAAAARILTEGTQIKCALSDDLSGKTANVGDKINFTLAEPVIVGDLVLVPAGAKISGTITEAESSKMLGKKGKLSFSIDYLYVPGGKAVKLTSTVKKDGKSRTGATVAAAVVLSPVFLLVKGKQAKYETGQIFTAYIEHDVVL